MIGASKKLLQATAGNAGGGPLDITDVFSTYLYTGTNSAQTIENGLDLASDGGLVWVKARSSAFEHVLVDTERGVNKAIYTNLNAAESSSTTVSAFNSNGFSIPNAASYAVTNSGTDFASWTFRKAPKFFDVIKYSGDSNATRSIPHGLGSSVGMIIIKTLNANDNWLVYHRGLPNGLGTGRLKLNNTNAVDGTTNFLSADSSSVTFASNAGGNYSGNEYVMYLFAHNDSGDGEFGPDGDQDIIKCGDFGTNSGGISGVSTGFEPQFVMVKRTDASSNWVMLDTMRGFTTWKSDDYQRTINANTSDAEYSLQTGGVRADSFVFQGDANATYIYMAIRRGPLAPPESATEVFAIDTKNSTGDNKTPLYRSGFPIDLALLLDTDGGSDFPQVHPRLTSTHYLRTNNTAGEESGTAFTHDFMNGFRTDTSFNVDTTRVCHMWKRAPGFFDVVAYNGTGSNLTINHNLGVEPELIMAKSRSIAGGWPVYTSFGQSSYTRLYLSSTNAGQTADYTAGWGIASLSSTAMVFQGLSGLNQANQTHVAYLFASLPGISKVGSYTATGSNQTIDCGFTSGARFVLIKRTSDTASWVIFDTVRGITTGNDAVLKLDITDAEEADDMIDPHSSGFIVKASNHEEVNASGSTYIFYAIA